MNIIVMLSINTLSSEVIEVRQALKAMQEAASSKTSLVTQLNTAVAVHSLTPNAGHPLSSTVVTARSKGFVDCLRL